MLHLNINKNQHEHLVPRPVHRGHAVEDAADVLWTPGLGRLLLVTSGQGDGEADDNEDDSDDDVDDVDVRTAPG